MNEGDERKVEFGLLECDVKEEETRERSYSSTVD